MELKTFKIGGVHPADKKITARLPRLSSKKATR